MCCELGNDIPTAFRSYLVLRGVEDITLNVQPDHCLYVGLSVGRPFSPACALSAAAARLPFPYLLCRNEGDYVCSGNPAGCPEYFMARAARPVLRRLGVPQRPVRPG